jgi:hypothetical protein
LKINELYFARLIWGKSELAAFSGSAHGSPALSVFPQYPHVVPSFTSQGLCEAQVPLNSPFFKKINRTDMSTKNSAMKPTEKSRTVIFLNFTQQN